MRITDDGVQIMPGVDEQALLDVVNFLPSLELTETASSKDTTPITLPDGYVAFVDGYGIGLSQGRWHKELDPEHAQRGPTIMLSREAIQRYIAHAGDVDMVIDEHSITPEKTRKVDRRRIVELLAENGWSIHKPETSAAKGTFDGLVCIEDAQGGLWFPQSNVTYPIEYAHPINPDQETAFFLPTQGKLNPQYIGYEWLTQPQLEASSAIAIPKKAVDAWLAQYSEMTIEDGIRAIMADYGWTMDIQGADAEGKISYRIGVTDTQQRTYGLTPGRIVPIDLPTTHIFPQIPALEGAGQTFADLSYEQR